MNGLVICLVDWLIEWIQRCCRFFLWLLSKSILFQVLPFFISGRIGEPREWAEHAHCKYRTYGGGTPYTMLSFFFSSVTPHKFHCFFLCRTWKIKSGIRWMKFISAKQKTLSMDCVRRCRCRTRSSKRLSATIWPRPSRSDPSEPTGRADLWIFYPWIKPLMQILLFSGYLVIFSHRVHWP